MRYLLFLALPMALVTGDIGLVRKEAFKKTENLQKIEISNRPEKYIALVKRLDDGLLQSQNAGDSILVDIVSARLKSPNVFQDFDEVYEAHVVKYTIYGEVKSPGSTVFLRLFDVCCKSTIIP